MAERTAVGSSLSPTLGNGIAYFGLWYAAKKYGVNFDDPEMALLFAGGVVGSILLELRRLGSGIVYVFNRIFPERK